MGRCTPSLLLAAAAVAAVAVVTGMPATAAVVGVPAAAAAPASREIIQLDFDFEGGGFDADANAGADVKFNPVFQSTAGTTTCVQLRRCGTETVTKYVKGAVPYGCLKKGEEDADADGADGCTPTDLKYVDGGELKSWSRCTCRMGARVTAEVPKMCREQVACTYATSEGEEEDDDDEGEGDEEED